MKEVTLLKPIVLASGSVKLSKEQLASRLHNLINKGDGVYEIKRPIGFKAGEIFEYDGVIPKSHYDAVDGMSEASNNLVETETDEKAEKPLESLHWKQIEKMVKDAGGEYTDKPSAIEFLKGLD